MTTINLQQNQENEKKGLASRGMSGGFFFSLGILIVTLLALFGLKFYTPIIEARNIVLGDNISAENGKLVGLKNLEQIIDMQKRLEEVKKNLKVNEGVISKAKMAQVIDRVGKEMDKGVVVSSYSYSANKVVVNFKTNNFNYIAKQLVNLKKSNYFTDINVSNISRGESDISFVVEMRLKEGGEK